MNTGATLSALRIQHSISRRTLAHLLGCSKDRIARIETRSRAADREILERAVQAIITAPPTVQRIPQVWTPAEDAILIEGLRAGTTTKDIAKLLGRSRTATQTRKQLLMGKQQEQNGPIPMQGVSERITDLVQTIRYAPRHDTLLLLVYRKSLLGLLAHKHGIAGQRLREGPFS